MEVVFFALQSFKKWINSLPLLPQFYCTREIWHRRSNWKKVFNPNTKNDLTTRKTGWSKPGCSSKSLLMKRFQIPQGPNHSVPFAPAPHKAFKKKRPWNPSTKTPSYVISTTSLLEALALAAILTWQGWCVDEKTRNICMDFSSYKAANKTCFLVLSFICCVLLWSIHYLFTFVPICS